MQWHMPIGYKMIDGKITIHDEGRKIVEQIFKDYADGVSATRIAIGLKASEIKNAQDRVSWSHVSVGKILENRDYLGNEYYPQIISEELFGRVQKRREQVCAELKRGKYISNVKEKNLFSGVLTCAECGEPYIRIRPDKSRRRGIPKWKCRNYVYHKQTACGGGFISDQQIMELCVRAMNQLLHNPKMFLQVGENDGLADKKNRELRVTIGNQKDNQISDSMEVLYERASERYRTLKIEDQKYKTEEMLEFLSGIDVVRDFHEDLYRKLIKQVIVCKDHSAKVIFYNESSVKIDYEEDIKQILHGG